METDIVSATTHFKNLDYPTWGKLQSVWDFSVVICLCFKAIIVQRLFHLEISFIHTQILVRLHVNKTNFHMKGFALRLALKQRQKATQKWVIQHLVLVPLEDESLLTF